AAPGSAPAPDPSGARPAAPPGPPTAPPVQPAAPPVQPAAAAGAGRQRAALPAGQCVAVSLLLLATLILGFLGYLFGASGIQEAGAQHRLYATLARELGQEIGPLGPTRPGAPVALISIPAIGLRSVVVVEGTSAEELTLGPGHLRSTPLPGQLGMSVIYGRRATFGAPFGHLNEVAPGDKITTITQQGISVYRVVALGDSQHPVTDTTLNRLVLMTANSPQVPAYYLEVDADLVTKVNNGPVELPDIGPAEQALAGDSGALVLTMVWGLALALVAVGGAAAAGRWSPWPVYLVVAPVALAITWNLYENLAALLPNLY
ncbi:MAG: sortase domain-bontaining protein, partial [Streptosporangiaceae bacterium]